MPSPFLPTQVITNLNSHMSPSNSISNHKTSSRVTGSHPKLSKQVFMLDCEPDLVVSPLVSESADLGARAAPDQYSSRYIHVQEVLLDNSGSTSKFFATASKL